MNVRIRFFLTTVQLGSSFYLIEISILVVAEEPKVDENAEKLPKPNRFRIQKVQESEGDIASADTLEEVSGGQHEHVDRHRVLRSKGISLTRRQLVSN